MPYINNIKLLPRRPGQYGAGIGLALWLITANSFNSIVNPSFTDTRTVEPLISIDANYLYDQTELVIQRKEYRLAESALRNGHLQTFNQLLQKLTNYPLYPYLEYQQMSRRPDLLERHQVDKFFEINDGSIMADKLRRKLIDYYAKHNRWDDLVHIYQPQTSTRLQCKYLQALIHTGQTKQAFEMTRKLWLAGRSQPKTCDPVFDAWEAAGQRTDNLTWQRIKLAMAIGHYQLAEHLSQSLPATDHKLVLFWSKIHRKPELVSGSYIQHLQHEAKNDILIHAVKRMGRQDTNKAIDLWQKLSSTHTFTQHEEYTVYRDIGLRLARNHQPEASQWLNRIPLQFADTNVLEWDIRTAIRIGDWQQTLSAIENLPVQDQANLRWQFWWAYAHEQLGNVNDAEGIYHYLAGRRSYYGFLAADRLKLPYDFENRPLDIHTADLLSISQYPEASRAHELYKLNKMAASRREWQRLTESLSEHQKLAASKLAQYWGWHDRAIITMGKTDYRDDIELRFPLALKDKVEEWSTKHSIETAWTYAIIRRESAFMHDAKSPVGALGLMQILPGTARQVARNLNVRYRGRNSLLLTDTNIKLGTGYLEQMLQSLDSQAVLATAAYNAGPSRVRAWLPETQPMEAIRWVETIPFAETREYVSNVLAYTIIYQHLMHDEYTTLLERMPLIQPKNPAPPATIVAQIPTDTTL